MNQTRDTVVATKYVKRTGNSFAVYLTSEIKVLGLDEGDPVEITIRRIKE